MALLRIETLLKKKTHSQSKCNLERLHACMMIRNFAKDITNNSTSSAYSGSGNKTPSRKTSSAHDKSFGVTKTPGSASRHSTALRQNSKTPSKTPGGSKASKLTPSRNPNVSNRTPGGGGDRFIPNRRASQFELGHYVITSQQSQNDSQSQLSLSAPPSPARLEYGRIMSESLNGGITAPQPAPGTSQNDSALSINSSLAEGNYRILAYQKGKAPLAPQGHANLNRVLYTARAAPVSSCKKTMRHIPATPDRILDAPDMLDDYYLNLVDWNSSNVLGVGLGGQVFLWNATTADIQCLLELDSTSDYVSSLSWLKDGAYLGVGLSTGEVQIWDVESRRRLRNMTGHTERVGALSWNSSTLSSGSKNGEIRHNDVRIANPLLQSLTAHSQEICGLKWSPDQRHLASGGNDNLLHVWAPVGHRDSPLHTFTDHQAAVKAVSWCPWQPSVLASGGGTADRHIRFWSVSTGAPLSATDTESQVSAILWSAHYKEVISGHGYPSNQLSVWKYGGTPMTKITDLIGHTGRVLHMALSPCGEYVMSGAADESLRLWHSFAVDPAHKKKQSTKQTLTTRKPSQGTMATRLR